MPVQITNQDVVIGQGQVVTLESDPQGYYFTSFADPSPDLINSGTVTVLFTGGNLVGIAHDSSAHSTQSSFINQSTGIFHVIATAQDAVAWGFYSGSWAADFENHGLFDVQSLKGFAVGVSVYDPFMVFTNTGVLSVTAGLAATGVEFANAGTFINSGDILVSGARNAEGIYAYGHEFSFENSGRIIAVNSSLDFINVAVQLYPIGGQTWTINNSGLIYADYAIYVAAGGSPPQDNVEFLNNTGEIVGAISLDLGNDIIHNSGLIDGAIDLGGGFDRYIGGGGVSDGPVSGGMQADAMLGGAGADTFFGDDGNDALAGGDGDDFIDGGRGADNLDGGAGYDVLSYATSYTGLTLDIALGQGETAGKDSFRNFEHYIATAYVDSITGSAAGETIEAGWGNDTVNGAGGADVIYGDGGNDTLTGGAGDDHFLFTKGDGADTVTDFVAGGTEDRLQIYGYSTYQQLKQQGSDTLVVLSATDSILLKNVQVSALTSADLVFNTTPLGPAAEAPGPRYALETTEAYVVYQGETMSIEDRTAIYLTQIDPFVSPAVFNFGTINVTNPDDLSVPLLAFDLPGGIYLGTFLHNGSTGVINVNSQSAGAWGYGNYVNTAGNLYNDGVFTVTCLQGSAYGMTTWDADGVIVANTGTFTVTGTLQASGIEIHNGGSFWNSGTLNVSGGVQGVGVLLFGAGSSFFNSGTIKAVATTAGYHSAALDFAASDAVNTYFNTGVLDGYYAVVQTTWTTADYLNSSIFYNSGQLKGLVEFTVGHHEFYNRGSITGHVTLGEQDDLYDGRLGTELGGVSGGAGNDAIYAGSGADVLDGGDGADVLTGGSGNDTLTGGAGNDSFRFEAGSGADTITDFTAGGAEDAILVVGYSGYQSLTQQGSDTLVRFSSSDTLLLKNVQASALTAADFQFNVAALAGTPATPTAPVNPTRPTVPTFSGPFDLPIGGGDGDDVLTGTAGWDTMDGAGGNDIIRAGGGLDHVWGGRGADEFQYRTDEIWYDDQPFIGHLDVIHDFSLIDGDVVRLDGAGTFSVQINASDAYIWVDLNGDAGGILLSGAFGDSLRDAVVVGKTGTSAGETLTGTSGGDWLEGLDGNDSLQGGDGADILEGGAGNDTMNGGAGRDTADYRNATAGVNVTLASVTSQNTSGAGNDTLSSIEDLNGSRFTDTLTGDSNANWLRGAEGADTLNGGGGDDNLVGGAGDDLLDGGTGNDRFYWAKGEGHDTINGFTAGGSEDRLQIDGFSTYRLEQQGSDLKVVFDADNWILLKNVQASAFTSADINLVRVITQSGGANGDSLTGTAAYDYLEGLGGADVLTGGAGDDVLLGGDGDDRLIAGAGVDYLDGGAGVDTVDYTASAYGAMANLGIAFIQATGADGPDSLLNIENVRGSAFDDNFTGGDGANKLEGLDGADILAGGAGADDLNGGNGNDILTGGLGADTLTLGADDDTVKFAKGDGADIVNGFTGGFWGDSITVTGYEMYDYEQIGADLKLIFSETDSILLKGVTAASFVAGIDINLYTYNQVVGTAGNDVLTGIEGGGFGPDKLMGLDGDDVLDGRQGSDLLLGGAGNDRLNGGYGSDNDILNGGDGNDTADYSGTNSEYVIVSLELTGPQQTWGSAMDTLIGIENLKGTRQGDTFTGNEVSNRLDGDEGADVLWGRAGDDILLGGLGADSLNGEDGADDLQGGDDADTLNGGAGADKLRGGAGDDAIDGGAGDDVIYFAAGDGQDTVTGFTAGGSEDRLEVTGFSTYTLVQEGANLRVVLGAGNSILLLGVQASAFTSADINLPQINFVNGTSGGETLLGSNGTDQMAGLGGNDILRGMDGTDTLDGGDGDDVLEGGAGDDVIVGGLGVDTADYTNAAGGVSVSLGTVASQNTGGAGADTISGVENLRGSAFNDTLTGDSGANRIEGLGGDDTLRGGLGADLLEGGTGNDTFVFNAGDGNDSIVGFLLSGFDDSISVSGYATYNVQQIGADLKIIFDANNSILLLNNNIGSLSMFDVVGAQYGYNLMAGTSAGETLTGSGFADKIEGFAGADTLKGGNGNDWLIGGDDNDLLEGSFGDDILDGGAGTNDKADYRSSSLAVTVNLSILTAQNTGGAGTDTLIGIEQVLGSAFNDTLTGDAFANTLDGKDGNDSLFGGSGGDILIGGLGADAMNGGGDLDYASYINATAGVGINLTTGVHTGEAAGDTFVSIERYRLSANNDSFVGAGATDYAYGAEGSDTLSGAGGIDRLYGQDGNDTLNGDAGNDILLGGAGADVFNGGADRDTASYEESTIALSINMTTGVHTGDAAGDTFNSVEILWLSKFGDTYVGSAGDDEVRGYDGNDTLNGAGGIDTLRGENGADVLNGDDGDDLLNGGLGADALHGGNGTDTAVYLLATAGVTINLTTGVHGGEAAGDTFDSVEHFQLTNGFTLVDTFTGSAGDDWVAGYKGVDNLFGMDGKDTLNGGEHNDVLDGGAGNDKLYGGIGNDQLTGGAGADQFIVNAKAFGADIVTDFENGVDKIRIQGVAGWDDFSDVLVSSNGSGWAVITFSDGSTITLTGVLAGDVDASDFLWS